MQVKIVVGTIAFMLTIMIFGFAILQEPARLERFTAAFEGRSIENGAHLFENNCATCHGVNGKAEACFSPSGEQIACQGFVLNNPELLCGEPSQRMVAWGWAGTKSGFIRNAVAAGRPGGIMPTWSEEFGGPLREAQIDDVTLFVLNWEDAELCGEGGVITGPEWPGSVADLPTGNPSNGEQLYNIALGCAACHGDINVEGSNAVGPWLGNVAETGAAYLDGYTAADYVYESILNPSAFISPECPTGPCAGPPSGMPANFGTRMTPQDMADVISYLLGTTEFESTAEITNP